MTIIAYFGLMENPYADRLYRLRPKNDEERLAIKRQWYGNPYDRNWELGQYDVDHPPKYDLWVRRQKYPEHYGDKYNTFERFGPIW